MRQCVCPPEIDGDDSDRDVAGRFRFWSRRATVRPASVLGKDWGLMDRGLKWRLSQGHPLDDYPRERSTDPLSTVLGSLVGTFSVVSITWMIVLGFVGGTVPVVGWQLPGGVVGGLAWLMVVGSLGTLLLWFVPLMLSMAAYAGLSRLAPALARAAKRPKRPAHHPGSPISRAA
jgi:hypothetical protein